MTMIAVNELAGFLLELYAGANESPMAQFMPDALRALKRRLRFDAAWWGMRGLGNDGGKVYCSYVDEAPRELPDLWRTLWEGDAAAVRLLTHSGSETARLEASVFRGGEGLRWLARASGVHNVLCTESTSEQMAHGVFLCLFRRDERDVFTEDERQLKQLVMPHLQSALRMNRAAHLRRLAPQADAGWALIDQRGSVHDADGAFVRAIEQAWPHWCGPLLPHEMLSRLGSPVTHWAGRGLAFDILWHGDLAMFSARPVSLLDRLSARERLVAEAFGAGLSYKEVARQLEMAPTTVRHHLRNVYVKLGVGNKAAITRIVGGKTRLTD
jgi:DNA-binding CsgD family transcriptional regulator